MVVCRVWQRLSSSVWFLLCLMFVFWSCCLKTSSLYMVYTIMFIFKGHNQVCILCDPFGHLRQDLVYPWNHVCWVQQFIFVKRLKCRKCLQMTSIILEKLI